jgi:hypothetical protein
MHPKVDDQLDLLTDGSGGVTTPTTTGIAPERPDLEAVGPR